MSLHTPAKVSFGPGSRRGIALLAILCLLPAVASLFTDHEERSKWEKRELATWKAVTETDSVKNTIVRLENYINDHIGFALPLNRVYRTAQFYLFGDSPVPNVSLGTEDFQFLNSHNPNKPFASLSKLCRPSVQAAAKTRKKFAHLAQFMTERGGSVTLAIAPSKLLLYPDHLPETVPLFLRNSCLNINPLHTTAGRLANEQPNPGFRVHFPILEMLELRDREAFYPAENFHANSMINHLFSRGLLRALRIEPGEAYSQGAYLKEASSDLTMLGFNQRITVWKYPYASYQVSRKLQQPEWIREHYPLARDFATYTTAHPASERRALLLSNSFGAFFSPHLAPGFRELYHINTNNLTGDDARAFLEQVMTRLQPTDVIYLLHDAGIPNTQLTRIVEGVQALGGTHPVSQR